MNTYRLYTRLENTEGVDFNDDSIIILTKTAIDKETTVALIIDTRKSYEPYIVAYGLDYVYEDRKGRSLPDNTIDWMQGHYFKDFEDAYKKYKTYSQNDE